MAKIVIVENDKDIGPLMEQLLLLEGHQVIWISDPSQAMESIRRHRPALVYLDLRLGGQMDGFAVLRQIRAELDTPVLMSSGLDMERECLRAGANGFLFKPFDFTELLEAVNRVLAGSEAG